MGEKMTLTLLEKWQNSTLGIVLWSRITSFGQTCRMRVGLKTWFFRESRNSHQKTAATFASRMDQRDRLRTNLSFMTRLHLPNHLLTHPMLIQVQSHPWICQGCDLISNQLPLIDLILRQEWKDAGSSSTIILIRRRCRWHLAAMVGMNCNNR